MFAAGLLYQVMAEADQQDQNLNNKDARTEDISMRKICKTELYHHIFHSSLVSFTYSVRLVCDFCCCDEIPFVIFP